MLQQQQLQGRIRVSSSRQRRTSVRRRGLLPLFQSSDDVTEVSSDALQNENSVLRETIRQLEEENQRLKQKAKRIVLENFEGDGFRDVVPDDGSGGGITLSGEEIAQDEQWLSLIHI